MKAMKATTFILALIFAMNFTLLFAGDPKYSTLKDDVKTDNISFYHIELAPVTPKEAFFNDVEPLPATEIIRLAPITPKEAIFEDSASESIIQSIKPVNLGKVIPITPKEAEFEDPKNY